MRNDNSDPPTNPQVISAAVSTQHSALALPFPRVPMSVRVATREDIPFMDALQKKHSKALGFFSRKMFEGYIDAGHVLIAEESGQCSVNSAQATHSLPTAYCPPPTPLGYVISRDRYLKRDELGAVFQLCVAPGHERSFIGANLLREVFERSSYGCRLYCCWCAQDLPANKFWEAMGFVPIAYRCGGRGKVGSGRCAVGRKGEADSSTAHRPLNTAHRIHIYWQKRIRAGDTSTPYWFPAKTEGGAIREDRIILPIPPGMRWTDELPVLMSNEVGDDRSSVEGESFLLAGVPIPVEGDGSRSQDGVSLGASDSAGKDSCAPADVQTKVRTAIPRPRTREKRTLRVTLNRENRFAAEAIPSLASGTPSPSRDTTVSQERVVETNRDAMEMNRDAAETNRDIAADDHRAPVKRTRSTPAKKVSTELIQKARELRDRYLEAVNEQPQLLSTGKYDVTRTVSPLPLLRESARLAA